MERAKVFGIRGIPTLIRCEIARQSGAMRAEGVVAFAGVKAGPEDCSTGTPRWWVSHNPKRPRCEAE